MRLTKLDLVTVTIALIILLCYMLILLLYEGNVLLSILQIELITVTLDSKATVPNALSNLQSQYCLQM